MPADVSFAWELIERPANSNASLSDPAEIRPVLTIDQPGTYRVSLVVANAASETSEPDIVSITAVLSAVIAQGVGLSDGMPGRITLALPGPPIQALLSWMRLDGADGNQIQFSNGAEDVTLSGMATVSSGAERFQCFYADITPHILDSPEAITYTVTHPESIPGAGIVVIASELEASVESFVASDSGRLALIRRITLGAEGDPRQRTVEVQAGCLFFRQGTSESVIFEIAPSPHERPAKVTLLLGDAQSSQVPRRSEIEFASPVEEPLMLMSLGKDETGLIANDGCHWDTFGRNSGAVPPVEGCHPPLFPTSEDPDRRGDVTIPAGASSALVQVRSPVPQESDEARGVSAVLSLVVFELILDPLE
ncbi:MAG: hypothetical protein ETSY2_49315 [Candidatus Entotheonella gemina]|uniref:PKD domain-containing protein n=1 Tax=Candidatus Entotheonella gemina TaxID=1429439 RepID=W4LBM1_9BACT|nr:MAG: hypothetical protein ETSY2_49315 [Candidatus Entotheonella gemina]